MGIKLVWVGGLLALSTCNPTPSHAGEHLRSHEVGILVALAQRLQGQEEGERLIQLQRASLLVWVASIQGAKEGYTCPDTLTLPLRVEGGEDAKPGDGSCLLAIFAY